MRHHGEAALMLAIVSYASVAGAQDLGEEATAVLKKHCAACHDSAVGGDSGGFDSVLSYERLLASGLVVRESPDESLLLERVEDDEMPPRSIKERPTTAEKDVLRKWILAGAPAPVATAPSSLRRRIGFAAIEKEIASDLGTLEVSARPQTRYLTIGHLYDAEVSAESLKLSRAGAAKLLASLSWKRELPRIVWIGAEQAIARVELRELGWSREQWDSLARTDPYALRRSNAAARRIARLTRTETTALRADWFATAVTRPDRYHSILSIPKTVRVLERKLGVRSNRPLIRAGFNRSGISKHNRIIERRETRIGSYLWRSYDFRGSSARRSIFDHPLGPGGRDGFTADGGELIFGLPNGMQAYMLVDASGKRIDKAPTDVVFDPSRPDGAVENGISCMGCHVDGMIDKADEVRAHLITNRRAFDARNPRTAEIALRIYRPRDELDAAFEKDRARFESALDALGVNTAREPITALAEIFDRELDLKRAAAEFGLSELDLRTRISKNSVLGRNLGALALRGGTIKRDVFAELFPRVASALGIGQPLDQIAPEALLAARCEDGDGSDCLSAGRDLRRIGKFRRSRIAFEKACDRRVARGCREAANLTRDVRRANRLLGRGCDQADSASCALLATRLRTSNPSKALALSLKLCRGGRGRSCVVAGDLRAKSDRSAEADALYRKACDLGNAAGCIRVANELRSGGRKRSNKPLAASFYVRACDAGDPRSCIVAGKLFYKGDDMAKQRGLSAQLFEKACRANSAEGCYRFAKQLRSGKGIRRDKPRAKRLFKQACRLGKKRACLR